MSAHGSTHGAIATPAPLPPAPPGAVEAVLFATAAFEDGPTAALPWEGGTVLERLHGQLASLGAATVHLITRPGLLEGAEGVRHSSADVAEDLRTVARIARGGKGPLVLAGGDIVAHRELFAGLLLDPRLGTAVLVTAGRLGSPFTPRVRLARGRVVSAASAYHAVRKPNARFLGVLKVAAADRPALATAAERLARLVAPPRGDWEDTLVHRTATWQRVLARRAAAAQDRPPPAPEEPVTLSGEDEARLRRRVAAAEADVPALLLVGLVRSHTHVGVSYLRRLYWGRPLTRDKAAQAALDITGYDEDKVLLDSAVKGSDGFFTTFFVSPYSRYIARWAAHRGFTPNQITTVSLLIGVAAAIAFATGARAGLIAGAVLLQVSFTTDCVDGQLARYTRRFSKLGAWLDSVFDRTKEYAVFAGLAIGGHGAWVLAGAALALQTFRHTGEFPSPPPPPRRIGPGDRPPPGNPAARWGAAGAAGTGGERA